MPAAPGLRSACRSAGRTIGAPAAASAAVLALLIVIRIVMPEPFARLQNAAFDAMQRAAPRGDAEAVVPGSGVVVVDIDEASLLSQGQWPWPRSTVAELIARLQDAGAAVIGLDLVFAEPDRSSPAALAPRWARDYGLAVTASEGSLPDYDRDLATTIARGRVVTGYGLIPAANDRAPAVANSVAMIGGTTPPALANFAGAVPNLPAFDAAAAGQGSFSIAEPDADEVVRRLPLFSALNGTIVPSLVAEVIRVTEGEDAGLALRAEHGGSRFASTVGYTARIGDRTVPIETDGAQWLRFGRRDPARTLPALRVLAPSETVALHAAVAGRIVLVGTSATGLADLRPTPLSAFEPGVRIHATAIEEILANDILTRPFWAAGAETRLSVLFGLGLAGAMAWRGTRAAAAVLMAGCGAAGGGAMLAFSRFDLLVDPSFLVLSGAACFVATLAARHVVTERKAGALRTAFGQYLSPQLVDALARDPGKLRLGGEERELTFLFTDLEGFTAFTETVAPALLVSTLNRYLDGVCAIVLDHGGTIDKIVGDAVHVMFNAPLDQPDHAVRAVRCALAIDEFAQGFSRGAERLASEGPGFGNTRIGVNTGRAVVGNFGGRRRFDYTAHGDAINTAARLEAANKRLGTRICVSRATVEAIGGGSDLRFRPIGALGLKGKALQVEVFAPAMAEAAESRWADRYGDAFARLSRGEEDGPEAILSLLAQFPEDPLLRFHAERIGRGVRGTDVGLQAA